MAALAEEPDAAAALMAQAVQAGAALPDAAGADPSPGESLARWAAGANDRAAKPFEAAALSVAGWRAAALRGSVLAARGDSAGALREFGVAAESSDVRAVLAGNLGRAALVLDRKGPALPGAGAPEAAQWARKAGEAAVAAGLAGQAMSAFTLATRASLMALQADEAVALIEPAYKRFVAAENKPAIGESGVLLARCALAAGRPLLAAEAAGAARQALADGGDAALLADAAWQESWAGWTLGRIAAAEAGAAALTGPRKKVADAMLLDLKGDRAGAVALLDLSGLDARDLAYGALAAARIDPDRALKHLQTAVVAADKTGDRSLSLSTRLGLEKAARGRRNAVAAKVRVELLGMAVEGPAGAGLRAEVAARSLSAGDKASLVGDKGVAANWAALTNGGAGVAADDPLSAGVGVWAQARAQATGAPDAASAAYGRALGLLPLHRRGALDSGTALDGSDGLDFETDLTALGAEGAPAAAIPAVLAVHELSHRLAAARADDRAGRDLSAGLDPEVREALFGAAARCRASMLRYLLGAGPLPTDDFKALAAAEAKAGEVPVFARLLPVGPPSIAELRGALDGSALLSYAVGPYRVHGAVLTATSGAARFLGKTDRALDLASRHSQALRAAAGNDSKASHGAGDGLRSMLIDPFMNDLSGYGRYLVIAPGEAFPFPFITFPEQADGLRWLAAIRTLAMSPDLRSVRIPKAEGEEAVVEKPYSPDFFGLGAPKAAEAVAEAPAAAPSTPSDKVDGGGTTDEDLLRRHRANANLPQDLGAASRQFGDDFRKIVTGGAASLESWDKLAENARYIHISTVDMAPDGGLMLADGALSIARIRTTPMRAELVIVTADAPVEVQEQRARAFLDAGAKAVMVTAWTVPPETLDRLFDGFYEAINRDRSAAASAREARDKLISSSINEFNQDDPGEWGALMLYARP